MTDGHYPGYREMLEKVDWDKYGVVNGIARDSRQHTFRLQAA